MRALVLGILTIIISTGCVSSPVNSDFVSPSVTNTIAASPPGYLQGKILYVVPEETTSVFLSNPDAKDHTLVLSGIGIRAVSLSPDAQMVAYITDEIVHIKDINDGKIRQLNSQPISGFFNRMEWSPDSKLIGFDCLIDGIAEICVLDVENGSLKILTDSKSLGAQFLDGATFGSWNEDGSQIAYCLKVSSPQGGIPVTRFMLLNVSDISFVEIMNEKNELGIVNYGCPVFQPHTKSILFSAKQDTKYMIFSANVDGHDVRRVTDPSIKYDIHDPITVSPTGQYFFANAAKQDSEELIDIPTLFSAEGQIILQLDLPGAEVVSWVNK